LFIVLSGFLGVGRACLEAGLYSCGLKLRPFCRLFVVQQQGQQQLQGQNLVRGLTLRRLITTRAT